MKKLLFVFAFACLGLFQAPAQTVFEHVDRLKTEYNDAETALQNVNLALLIPDRDAALIHIDDAIAKIGIYLATLQEPLTTTIYGVKPTTLWIKKTSAALVSANQTKTLIQLINSTPVAVFKSGQKTLKASRQVDKAATKAQKPLLQPQQAGDILILEELKSSSAGFQSPGKVVEFAVHGLVGQDGSLCEDVEVIVTNPSGENVVQVVDTAALATTSRFVVVMGDAKGGASVTVTACGKSSTRLLYNYGSSKPTVAANAAAYDGYYEGSYSGRAFTDFGSQNVDGPVRFTVSDGVITVLEPGSGTGSVSASGSAEFAGSGGGDGISYTFTGAFRLNGAASGSWNSTFDEGTANGSWSATRISSSAP